MSTPFVITTTVERTISDLASYRRDPAAEIEPLLLILDSRNFHWLELQLKKETTRVEAIRARSEPDREHDWQWPEGFRVIHEQEGHQTEQVVERGLRGIGISTIELYGMKPHEFRLMHLMRRKSFVSFSYRVGRQTKRITRGETPVLGTSIHAENPNTKEQEAPRTSAYRQEACTGE